MEGKPNPVAIAPSPNPETDDVTERPESMESVGMELSLWHALSADLASTNSGLAFIYRTLELLLEEWHIDDLVLVLEENTTGRQLFRAGRRAVSDVWTVEQVQEADQGLYAEIDSDLVTEDAANAVVSLCGVALRMDLLEHDAAHDPLTKVMNRRSFDRSLDQAVSRCQRYGWPFALAVIDLNDFKGLNDRLGHAAGDTVLAAIGAELRQSLRVGDSAARLGGDEFALILNEGSAAMLSGLLDRLVAAVARTGVDAEVGFSAGIATAPADGLDAAELYRFADQRLYEAKGQG